MSRFTYAGHPRAGTLYEHNNDLPDAVSRIKRFAEKHSQPVSWVINDQEYLNLEGLLPDLLRHKAGGDSILVTMELTTSPDGVDKMDTAAVLRWIHQRCQEAGFTPDGLWSLKFYPDDLNAILGLPEHDFAWTRNLAGSCWHQLGIDESTWLGCPFDPYYVAPWNAKAAAQKGDPQSLLMLEWLTRDITACLADGHPATFSLDPADANRKYAGGFDTEADALKYSVALIDEVARQRAWNETVVVNINEEARHYQTEGHDKDVMLDGMFRRFHELAQSPGVKQAAYAEVWAYYRRKHAQTPQSLFVCGDLDWRKGMVSGASEDYGRRPRNDVSLLYQDSSCQMGFLKSRGAFAVEAYDYAARIRDLGDNSPYPNSAPTQAALGVVRYQSADGALEVDFSVTSGAQNGSQLLGLVLWDAPVTGAEALVSADDAVEVVRAASKVLFVKLHCPDDQVHSYHFKLAAREER
ncbi:MAG: hypothetical protein IT209_12435 [Armatimonadetes bacterium]|nr:hypothetical protein [Armatimonadota bacterium]